MKKDLSGRVFLIDEARGLSILLMVVYHTFFDLVVLFGVNIPAFYSPFIQTLASLFAGLFIFISGTASHYSRNNWKRGLICFGLGMLLTLGTALIMPDEIVRFGILHLLGVCMLLFPLLKPLFSKIPPIIGVLLSLFLFFFCWNLPDGRLGLWGLFSISLPRAPYEWGFLFWLGFPGPTFFSSDYFPLFPWLFAFLAGGFFGVLVKEHRLPQWIYRPHLPFLAFIGRHTMIVYLLHQPVVYSVLWVIFFLLRSAA